MKKIILNLAVTLDGYIEGPNGEVDWCIMDDDMNFDAFLNGVDTLLYGRVSYDAWGNFVPDENAPLTEKSFWQQIHSKRKIVFSTQHQSHSDVLFISSDIPNEIGRLKKQEGKDIWLYGGANLIKTFIQLNLIDRYQLSVHPVVLGSGKPLFEDLNERLGLKLVETHVFKSGVIELIYEPEA